MRAKISCKNREWTVDLSKPLDLSITLNSGAENPRAWYQGAPEIKPVVMDDWIGSVAQGGSVNFNNINFNPHAHGTHTESYGHISEDFFSIQEVLDQYWFFAQVISITPESRTGDFVISRESLEAAISAVEVEAVVIRTLPNPISKKHKLWSGTNWPYLSEAAAHFLREKNVKHLLIDLPSVDKEKDDGKLLAHKAFWNYPEAPRKDSSITEMIFVPEAVTDGFYFLNLQVAAFENDAAPSRPVLYAINEEDSAHL